MGYMPDSALVAKRIGASGFVTVASAAYLARYGTPRALSDLDAHVAVNYFSSRTGRNVEMDFVLENKPVRVPMQSKLAVNDGDTYLQCGLQGLGLIQIPHFLAAEHLPAGNLVEVLNAWRPLPFPVWAVYPQSRHLSPLVRVFIDWVEQRFDACDLLRKPAAPLGVSLLPSVSGQIGMTVGRRRSPEVMSM